jgi:predicted Zn-dependent protease
MAAYRQTVKLEPNDADYWCSMAGLAKEVGRMDDAIEALQKAVKLTPNDANLRGVLAWQYASRAQTYSKSGFRRGAIEALAEAVKLKPDDADLWDMLATAYALDKQIGRARACISELKKLDAGKAQELESILKPFEQ